MVRINNATIQSEVQPLVANMEYNYSKILGIYADKAALPLGMADATIYSIAIATACRAKQCPIEEYLKAIKDRMHDITHLFVLYAFIDTAIHLKLNNIPILAGLADAAYEVAIAKHGRITCIAFMHLYINGALLLDAIDTKAMDEHKEQWFAICLLALQKLKKAQRLAILDGDFDMPIYEALLSLQIQTVHFAMVEPELKKGFPLGCVNALVNNHNISKAALRNSAELAYSYLGELYRKKNTTKLITTPYEINPNVALGI